MNLLWNGNDYVVLGPEPKERDRARERRYMQNNTPWIVHVDVLSWKVAHGPGMRSLGWVLRYIWMRRGERMSRVQMGCKWIQNNRSAIICRIICHWDYKASSCKFTIVQPLFEHPFYLEKELWNVLIHTIILSILIFYILYIYVCYTWCTFFEIIKS